LKHCAPRRIRAGLEDGPQSLPVIAMTQRLQRLRDRGRMMTEIVNHLNAARFAAKLLPARNAGETFECADDFRRGHVIKPRRGRSHCSVMNVEFANKRNFKNVVAKFKS